MRERRSHAVQMLGSLLVAVAIVAIAVIVMTAKIGADAGKRDDGGDNSGKGKSGQRSGRD
jgi:hypothetical protein